MHVRRLPTAAVVVVAVSLLPSCTSLPDRPPQREAYVVEAYHYCPECGTLQGGIYEKGPFKAFPGPNKETCSHQWEEITRERFKQLATDMYGADWTQESARFWSFDEDQAAAD